MSVFLHNQSGGGGGWKRIETSVATSSGIYTVPANCTRIDIALLSGGQGGSNSVIGLGGKIVRYFGIKVTPGQVFTRVIGAGGAAGGSYGGITSFGEYTTSPQGASPAVTTMWGDLSSRLVAGAGKTDSTLTSQSDAMPLMRADDVVGGGGISLGVGAVSATPGLGGGGYKSNYSAGSAGRTEIREYYTA